MSCDFVFKANFCFALGPFFVCLFLLKALGEQEMAQKHFLSHPGPECCSPGLRGLRWHMLGGEAVGTGWALA